MAVFKISKVIAVILLYATFSTSGQLFETGTPHDEWTGTAGYIAVNRTAVQQKLDAHFNSQEGCLKAPRLYLPEETIFPDLLDNNQHVMYFHFGRVTADDFKESLGSPPDPCLQVSGLESAVTIPFLTDRPGGQPMYSLALAMFYDKDRRDFPKTNLMYPYIPVEDIRLDDKEAYVKNGEEEFRVSLKKQVPCQPPPPLVRYRLQDFTNMNVQFGVPEPDFSFCDRHPMENRFCENARKLRCVVHRHAHNICQIWLSDDQHACQTSVEIENITQEFRDHFLQDDGPVTIVASETFFGNYTVGLKMPCVA